MTLAPQCASCGAVLDEPLDGPVCAGCWRRVIPLANPVCRACGDPLPSWRVLSVALEHCPRCRRRPLRLTAARAAGEYDGALRDILHAFKYEGRRGLAQPIGALMRAAGTELLHDADWLVPVPLHPLRRLRRGFNQSEDLAREIGLPVLHALRRTRRTSAQTGLSAAARARNVRGAFDAAPLWPSRPRRQQCLNRVIVLVDDVRTTGATLNACAEVLLSLGVKEVRALTAARAAPPGRGIRRRSS